EGLHLIKSRSNKSIPTNITTIQDFETSDEKDFMSYGSSTKNLYLLLMEDL
ncbi:lactate utilization protein B/C, partial [Flavobacteriaceae bacterium]|nr:lactate utilization protein B/C [Flavobacteriaceae bacterium]